MGTTEAVSLAHSYALVVRQEYLSADVYLFGSHASGTASNDSDIGIAIIVNEVEGNWLDKSARLWQLSQDISNCIEPVLLESDHDASGFVQHIRETGTLL